MSETAAGAGRHVFISCGEASGDRYGAALVRALRARDPGLRFSALGGPGLAAAGARLVQDAAEVAVMGFGEVLGALPAVLRARRRVWSHLDRGGIDLCIPVDFPGFNLALAGQARRRGIPVLYLVPPQLWAWGGWRLRALRRNADRVGTILPFETDFYRERGLDVVPIGHPLMEDYAGLPLAEQVAAREERLADARGPVTLGLLPGSRRQEIDRLLPVLRVTARLLRSRLAPRPLRVVLSLAPGQDRDRLLELAAEGLVLSEAPLRDLLPELDLALVCSGTASLEAALAGVPHEIVYATSPLSWWAARRLVRVRRIGLANLILGRDLVREHLQDAVVPVPLTAALLEWIGRSAVRRDFYRGAAELRERCGGPGAWGRAAAAALELLDARGEG